MITLWKFLALVLIFVIFFIYFEAEMIPMKDSYKTSNIGMEYYSRKRKKDKIDQIKNQFGARRKYLEDACTRYKSAQSEDVYTSHDDSFNQQVQPQSYLLDHRHQVMYCWNRKVASTSWSWIFKMVESGNNTNPMENPYKITPPESLSSFHMATSTYQNTILVRHPIVRLISAYRDRVAGLKASLTFYRAVAKSLHITRVDRKMQYSVQRRDRKGSNKTGPVSYWKKISVPTWPEFVRYLVMTNTSKDVS